MIYWWDYMVELEKYVCKEIVSRYNVLIFWITLVIIIWEMNCIRVSVLEIDKYLNFFISFIRTVSKVQILITLQALSLNIFYQRRIKVISMMNDELFKNFTISCNHAIGTTQSYELSLRKYCIYFDMSLRTSWRSWRG